MVVEKSLLLWMYERMLLSRSLEEALIHATLQGKDVRVGHPYIGQEAVAVGSCAALQPDDYVVSNHRSHGHAIAKGVNPRRFLAELFGRTDGVCRGKAGEMGMADYSVGFMSSTEVVAGNLPLGVGLALAAKCQKNARTVICFFGDGATNQGTFHESINLAAVLKLPVVFVCDNNGYAEATPYEYAVAGQNIAGRSTAYGIPGRAVDGQDVLDVHEAVAEAVTRARSGDGPSLVEARTYRYYGHYYGDAHLRYRMQEEVDGHIARDCIRSFKDTLAGGGLALESELQSIDERVKATVEDAFEFAQGSPLPDASELLTDVYAVSGGVK